LVLFCVVALSSAVPSLLSLPDDMANRVVATKRSWSRVRRAYQDDAAQ